MNARSVRTRIVAPFLAALVAAASAQATLIDSVDGLLAAFSAGGEYRIAPGTYTVDAALEATGVVRIVGDDREEVLIESRDVPIAVRVHEGAHLHLEGVRLVSLGGAPSDLIVVRQGELTLRGVDLGFARAGTIDPPDPWRSGGHGSAVVGQGSAVIALDDTRVTMSGYAALEMLGTSNLRVDASMIVDNLRGLIAGEESRIEMTDTVFLDQRTQAVVLVDDAQATFVGAGFGGNGSFEPEQNRFLEAIRVVDRARATFRGGVLRDSPSTGLAVGGQAEVVVDGTLIEANGATIDDQNRKWTAVFVTGDARVAVQRATIRNNAGGALEVRGSATLVVEDVTVAENGSYGHTTALEGATLVVQGSRFTANVGGMFVTGSARAVIDASEIVAGGSSGVVIGETATVDLVGNLIARNAARGVWIDGEATVDLLENTILANEAGLWMTGAATALVNDNRLLEHRLNGATLFGTTRAALARNEIAGNERHGVVLLDDSSGLLEDNEIVGNVLVGVLLLNDATATLERNTISGSESGVHLEDRSAAHGIDNVFADNGLDVSDAR